MATYCVKATEWSETIRWGFRDRVFTVADQVENYEEAVALAKSYVIFFVEGEVDMTGNRPDMFEINNHHFGASRKTPEEAYGLRAWVEEEWIF